MVFLEWSIGHVSVKSCLVAQQGNLLVLDYWTGHKPRLYGLAHATGVHERNTVPYARFALKKRHGFCAKAREKNM